MSRGEFVIKHLSSNLASRWFAAQVALDVRTPTVIGYVIKGSDTIMNIPKVRLRSAGVYTEIWQAIRIELCGSSLRMIRIVRGELRRKRGNPHRFRMLIE
jgi:hypothetical protein